MLLPNDVLYCIGALENAGFQAYAVGGCVRDALLGLTPHDYDLCTDAAPDEISRVFEAHDLIRNGEKHGTVGVILNGTVYEITTFRTEGGYTDSRHPDWVKFVKQVADDLARRDFTVNAMAYNPKTGYIDPFGGQKDLQNHVLRAVGDPGRRFTEDALRILRGVRFSVRFQLTPEPETENAMARLAPLMDKLAKERIFDELSKLLPLMDARALLRFAPVLVQAIPQLAPCMGFDQKNHHHAYDVFTHTAYVVENVPQILSLRFAALLHDIGKPQCFTVDEQGQGHFLGHAEISARLADEILRNLKAPNVLRERVVFLVKYHMLPLEPDKKILRRRLGKYGFEAIEQLLVLQKADMGSKGTGTDPDIDFSQVEGLIDQLRQEAACLTVRDLAVTGHDLMALGITGKAIGTCLDRLLELVQDEVIPNEKQTLLNELKKYN